MPQAKPVARVLTTADWHKDESRKQRLQDLCNDPIFREACATLLRSQEPSVPPIQAISGNQGEDIIKQLAVKQVFSAGYYEFLRDLEALHAHASVPVQPFPQPWEHILSPAAAAKPEKKKRA